MPQPKPDLSRGITFHLGEDGDDYPLLCHFRDHRSAFKQQFTSEEGLIAIADEVMRARWNSEEQCENPSCLKSASNYGSVGAAEKLPTAVISVRHRIGRGTKCPVTRHDPSMVIQGSRDPSVVELYDALENFVFAARDESVAAAYSSLKILTPNSLHLSHALVIWLTHDPMETNQTIAFKLSKAAVIPNQILEQRGCSVDKKRTPEEAEEHSRTIATYALTVAVPVVVWATTLLRSVGSHQSNSEGLLVRRETCLKRNPEFIEGLPPIIRQNWNDPDCFKNIQRRLNFPDRAYRRDSKPVSLQNQRLRERDLNTFAGV